MGARTGPVVHVGLHKTATTWLQRAFFPLVGRLANDSRRPWDDPVISGLVRGGRVHQVDDDAIISAERLSGYPGAGWQDADLIADRIQDAFPGARIIVGTRNHADWVPSLYRQLVYEGETRKLDTLLSPGWKMPHLDLANVSQEALERRYRSRFESVLFLPFEKLIDDPSSYIRMLCDFMQVEAPPEVDLTPVNSRRSWDGVEAMRRLNHFRRTELNQSPVVDATRLVQILQRLIPRTR